MYPSTGLKNALNKMREVSVESGSIFHQYVPVVTDSTSIGEYGLPILDPSNTAVLNDFFSLLKKVVFTAVYNKTFNNPLAELEGDRIPLGQFIENTYVNPSVAQKFNDNDFLGLLQKFEAQVAVEYLSVNSDLQYRVTATREKIRNAFTSWNNLEGFITSIINSLFNGAYITRYNQTKGLPLAAYKGNNIQYETVSAVSDESTAKALVEKLRAAYTKFQTPSTQFNAWNKVKGGEMVLKTWCDPEDIVVLVSADVDAKLSVQDWAYVFNRDAGDILGRKIVIDTFTQYNEDGTVAVDGSAIQAFICDKAWFKIKTQDFAMDEFYNMHNRSWQYGLNDVRMVNYSLFANALALVTSSPSIDATDLDLEKSSISLVAGTTGKVLIDLTPANATSTITVSSSASTYATGAVSGRYLVITAKEAGSATLTVTANGHSDTISVTVTAASE